MNLKELMKKDLVISIKNRDEFTKNSLRFLIGEMERGQKKDLTDGEMISILKKIKADQIKVAELKKDNSADLIVNLINIYLPKEVSKEEIKVWIQDNVDFSKYKNRLQAMRDIMNHFGPSAEGNLVRSIINEM